MLQKVYLLCICSALQALWAISPNISSLSQPEALWQILIGAFPFKYQFLGFDSQPSLFLCFSPAIQG